MKSARLAQMLIIVCIAVISLPVFVSAQKYLSAYIVADNSAAAIDTISIVEFNDYVSSMYVEGGYEGIDDVELKLLDSKGGIIDAGQVHSGENYFDYNTGISAVKLFRAGQEVFSSSISFCDNDDTCEPCEGPSCYLIENYLTCSDCSSGSNDNFCDTVSDGICDPDCDFDAADTDCIVNCTEYCDIDIDDVLSCSDYDGSICDADEDCIGGMMLDTADSMYCCYGGFCGVTGEHVESSVEMLRQPSATITPSGVLASTVQAVGISNYCTNTIGGVLCSRDSACTGNLVEFYYNTFCCIGTCTAPFVNRTSEYLAMVENDSNLPVPDDQIPVLFNTTDIEAEINATEELGRIDYLELEEGEFPHESLSQVEEEVPVISVAKLGEVAAAAQETLDKVSFVHVVTILLAILAVVALLVGLFRHFASGRVESEQKKVEVPAAQADLQAEINTLVAQGNDYRQIEQLLLRKGYDRTLVDKEIQMNYQVRLQAQRQRQR